MQRMGGGGNDPSCGCDMQAGWPSAADLPRGGLQGGGANINSFNLALVNTNGKTIHYRGKRNMNNNTMKTMMNMNTNTNKNNNMNMNNMNNNNMNMNNVMYTPPNVNNNTRKNKKPSSAPNTMKKIVLKGKRFYTSPNGNTYKRSAKGAVGDYVGKLVVSNNGSKMINNTLPPNMEPIDIETEGVGNNMNTNRPLSQDGGGKRHGKRCGCFLCTFKKLKIAGGAY